MKVVIIDYGLGNLHSIQAKLSKHKYEVKISKDSESILSADRLILPGVGHFKHGMENLIKDGTKDILDIAVKEKQIPLLGICLGMQLLFECSEEGQVTGLNWIEGKAYNFKNKISPELSIPHVGWNKVYQKKESLLFENINMSERFYFTHSYNVQGVPEDYILGTTTYGQEFTSIVRKNNIWGTQFHPEKSRKYGLHMIFNFLDNGDK